jgi:hypothetical protein
MRNLLRYRALHRRLIDHWLGALFTGDRAALAYWGAHRRRFLQLVDRLQYSPDGC